MPSFHRGVLFSPQSLSTKGLLGTDIPTASPGQWCFFSPPFRMPTAAQLQAMRDGRSVPVPPTLSMSGTLASQPSCKQQCSSDLTSVFQQMARDTNLLDTKIHEVQEVSTGWWGLKPTNHATKASQWDIQFFHVVIPNELPNIMGLKGIHSPETLH